MLKRGTTKRALLFCSFSLVLCVFMFVGTTWAWFTDSATSSENKIVSGTLEIVLEMLDPETDEWVDADGKVIPFISADGEDALWEPNCTYELAPIRVRNSGNLSAYVTVTLDGMNGDEELLDVLDFTVSGENEDLSEIIHIQSGTVIWKEALMPSGETDTDIGIDDTTDIVTLSVHMDSDAHNSYQGMSLDGISITATAIQYSYESDSFGNAYDSEAFLPTDTSMSDDYEDSFRNNESIAILIS